MVSQPVRFRLSGLTEMIILILEYGKMARKFKRGDKVRLNGSEGRVLRYYSDKMIEVRLFDGCRHIGDFCVDEGDANLYKPLPKIYAGTIEK